MFSRIATGRGPWSKNARLPITSLHSPQISGLRGKTPGKAIVYMNPRSKINAMGLVKTMTGQTGKTMITGRRGLYGLLLD